MLFKNLFRLNSKNSQAQAFDIFYIFCGLISFLPLLTNQDFHLKNTPLEAALQDEHSRYCFIASVALGFPILIDVLLDQFCPTPPENSLSQIVLVCTLVLPALYFGGNPDVYFIITQAQRILWKGASFSIMNKFDPEFVRISRNVVMMVVLMVIEALEVYGLIAQNRAVRIAAIALRYVYYCIPFWVGMEYFIRIYREKYAKLSIRGWRSWYELLETEQSSRIILYIVSITGILGQGFIPLYGDLQGVFFVEDYTTSYLIGNCLVIVACTWCVGVIPNRVTMYRGYRVKVELEGKRSLVRYVSHEIRTPLNTISVGLSLMETHLSKYRQKNGYAVNMVHELQESCNLAVRILTNMLDYEKLGAGLMTLDLDWISPFHFLHKLVRQHALTAEQKAVQLEVNIPEADHILCSVFADEGKIGIVIRNFISNAIKFTPENGKVAVNSAILHAKHDDSVLRWRVEVIDSGPGMSQENVRQLFKDIVQFHPNALQGGGGSGVGLWISKKIADLHGATVSVDSIEGQGSTFVLEMTAFYACDARSDQLVDSVLSNNHSMGGNSSSLGNSVYPTSRVHPSHEGQATTDMHYLRPMRSSQELPDDDVEIELTETATKQVVPVKLHMLVVDDSKVNRTMMSRLVRSKGHTVVECNDGAAAIAKYKASLELDGVPFQVILMDNQMPMMTGREASKLLRELGFHGVILGVTGDALQEDVAEFIRHGVDEVLTKPIDPGTFESIIQRSFATKSKSTSALST